MVHGPSPTPPPPGALWTGDWDDDADLRVYGADPTTVGPAAALLTGVQYRDGATVSGVALRIEGPVIGAAGRAAVTADLTPEQARHLADVLEDLADRAEHLDGLSRRKPRN